MDDEKSKLIDALASAISSSPQTEALFNALVPDEETDKEEKASKSKNDGSSLDLSILLKLSQMMSGLKHTEDDDRSRLLWAIKPFLSEDKRDAVDSAIKLLKLTSLLKLARELDLFKDFKL